MTAVWSVMMDKLCNRKFTTNFNTVLTISDRKTYSWQRNKLNLRLLILSICTVFSVLHEKILTALSRGGRQTQDICFSASRRHGRDFDTGCQGNLTRQASCFMGMFKKCAAVALACVFCTSFCLLLDCYALRRWHWNGMSCKTDKRGEREAERKRGVRPVTSLAVQCVWSWQGTQLRVTLLVGAAKLPLPVLFIHT